MEEESDGVFCLGKSKGCQDDKSLPPGFSGDESAFSNCTSPLILSKWRNKPSDSDGRWTITLQFSAPADGQQPLCPEHLGLLRATTRSGDIAGLAVTSSHCVKVAASVCLSRKLLHFEKLTQEAPQQRGVEEAGLAYRICRSCPMVGAAGGRSE